MFGKTQLEKIRLHKELLVARSEADRLLLALEWQRLSSVAFWQRKAGQSIREHPLLTASLGVGAGVLFFKALRHPANMIKWLAKLGGTGSTVFSAWKLFNRG